MKKNPSPKHQTRNNAIDHVKKLSFPSLFFIFLSVVFLSGCSGTSSSTPKKTIVLDSDGNRTGYASGGAASSNMSMPEMQRMPQALEKASVASQPKYRSFAELLEKQERKKGIGFFRNENETFVFFSLKSPAEFSITEKTGTCLYYVNIDTNSLAQKQNLNGIKIKSGPCGLKHPTAAVEAINQVKGMSDEMIPLLQNIMEGVAWTGQCTDMNFLKQSLLKNYPFEIEDTGKDIEGIIANIGMEVKNPLDIAFGDVVFFSPQKNKKAVGIYVGYGQIIFNNDCKSIDIHRLAGNFQYRFYRILTGFAWTNHQIPEGSFQTEKVTNP